MAEPITWIVLETLKTRLEAISLAGGYYQDIAGVELEAFDLDNPTDPPKDPQLHLTSADIVHTTQTSQFSELEISGLVECYLQPGEDSQLVAHRILADVARALPKTGADLPADVDKVTAITGRKVLQRPDGLPYIVAQVAFEIGAIERY